MMLPIFVRSLYTVVLGLVVVSATPTNVPISILQTRVSAAPGTRETTPAFNNNTFRDGGLSTNVNGYNLQVFQDSKTCKTPYFDSNCYYGVGGGNFTSGTHNSLAYFGYDSATSTTSNYTHLYTIGGTGSTGSMVLQDVPAGNIGGYFPIASNETGLSFLWPDAIETLPDNMTALIVVAINSSSAAYNTLYTVQAIAPSSIPSTGLNISRVATTPYGLFYKGETYYGNTDLMVGLHQDFIFFFANTASGIKVARSPVNQYGDRTQFQYYWTSTSKWNSTMPAGSSSEDIIASANISAGKFYYSNFHQTYVALLEISFAGWLSYSTTGLPVGPWSAPVKAFDIGTDPGCHSYGNANESTLPYYLTAHPGWYGTDGSQLLVGWAQCAAYVTMTTVNFATVS